MKSLTALVLLFHMHGATVSRTPTTGGKKPFHAQGFGQVIYDVCPFTVPL